MEQNIDPEEQYRRWERWQETQIIAGNLAVYEESTPEQIAALSSDPASLFYIAPANKAVQRNSKTKGA